MSLILLPVAPGQRPPDSRQRAQKIGKVLPRQRHGVGHARQRIWCHHSSTAGLMVSSKMRSLLLNCQTASLRDPRPLRQGRRGGRREPSLRKSSSAAARMR